MRHRVASQPDPHVPQPGLESTRTFFSLPLNLFRCPPICPDFFQSALQSAPRFPNLPRRLSICPSVPKSASRSVELGLERAALADSGTDRETPGRIGWQIEGPRGKLRSEPNGECQTKRLPCLDTELLLWRRLLLFFSPTLFTIPMKMLRCASRSTAGGVVLAVLTFTNFAKGSRTGPFS